MTKFRTEQLENLAASDIITGQFADTLLSESSITQHQAALTITESQISDLGTYSTATGVENNADVTDATNVTAAGALMDSEVTNLAQVKAFDTTDYVTPTGTETLTNKRINKRISTTTSTTTLTPSPANYDVYTLTAQAADLTIANPTGTPVIGDTIAIYVTDDATARAISFGTYYKGFGAALPTTTTSGKTLLITAQYYDTNLWSVLSAVQQ